MGQPGAPGHTSFSNKEFIYLPCDSIGLGDTGSLARYPFIILSLPCSRHALVTCCKVPLSRALGLELQPLDSSIHIFPSTLSSLETMPAGMGGGDGPAALGTLGGALHTDYLGSWLHGE